MKLLQLVGLGRPAPTFRDLLRHAASGDNIVDLPEMEGALSQGSFRKGEDRQGQILDAMYDEARSGTRFTALARGKCLYPHGALAKLDDAIFTYWLEPNTPLKLDARLETAALIKQAIAGAANPKEVEAYITGRLRQAVAKLETGAGAGPRVANAIRAMMQELGLTGEGVTTPRINRAEFLDSGIPPDNLSTHVGRRHRKTSGTVYSGWASVNFSAFIDDVTKDGRFEVRDGESLVRFMLKTTDQNHRHSGESLDRLEAVLAALPAANIEPGAIEVVLAWIKVYRRNGVGTEHLPSDYGSPLEQSPIEILQPRRGATYVPPEHGYDYDAPGPFATAIDRLLQEKTHTDAEVVVRLTELGEHLRGELEGRLSRHSVTAPSPGQRSIDELPAWWLAPLGLTPLAEPEPSPEAAAPTGPRLPAWVLELNPSPPTAPAKAPCAVATQTFEIAAYGTTPEAQELAAARLREELAPLLADLERIVLRLLERRQGMPGNERAKQLLSWTLTTRIRLLSALGEYQGPHLGLVGTATPIVDRFVVRGKILTEARQLPADSWALQWAR